MGFQFKQFRIEDDRCAMKVNTDGILLGALADIQHAKQILDLGTGSGLIAIMLAQRTAYQTVNPVQITAVELDSQAFLQALQNIAATPWANRINTIYADMMTSEFPAIFDLIVANPPYFEHSPATRNPQRDLARTASHSHLDWLKQAAKWLSPTGKISFILPFDAGEKLSIRSENIGLFCIEKWEISSKIGHIPKRMIVTFHQEKQDCQVKSLAIYDQENRYTSAFQYATKAFYLKM